MVAAGRRGRWRVLAILVIMTFIPSFAMPPSAVPIHCGWGKKPAVEDRAELRTGLRSLELRRQPDEWGKSFTFVVNGIAVFAKGGT
jgi:hypothetical protein